MAISMTGFGRGEYKDNNYHFLAECKTINHKYCDINIRLPRKISFLEDKARNFVKNHIKRGRVDIYIKLDLLGSEDVNLKFDEALASQYVNILKEIRDKYDLVDDISVMNIAKFPEIIKTEENKYNYSPLFLLNFTRLMAFYLLNGTPLPSLNDPSNILIKSTAHPIPNNPSVHRYMIPQNIFPT